MAHFRRLGRNSLLKGCHSAAMSTAVAPFVLAAHGGYIAGQWVTTGGPGSVDVVNPATGALVAKLPNMGATETEAAVNAARAAFPAWAARTAADRGAALRRLHDLMGQNVNGLAALLTLESGKPFEEAKGEIAYSMSYLDWFAEEGKRQYGDIIPSARGDRRMMTLRQPVGVAALLTPWNFSSAMIARKLAPALAAGCTVVIRPSANTPLSALAIVQLAIDAGLPPGVINVVVGHDHDAIAGTLCRSRAVAKLSFTGSTRVGRILMAQCAPTLKRLSMELGGNAPFIVFDDADIDQAVEGAMLSKFRNAGQTCVCANRIFVHASIYNTFRERLVRRVEALRVGNGMTPGVTVGPVISRDALERIDSWVREAVTAGARVLTGGVRPDTGSNGYFYAPTVIEAVPASCSLATEEIFGPVAALETFTDDADVLLRANATEFGLAGYFYSR